MRVSLRSGLTLLLLLVGIPLTFVLLQHLLNTPPSAIWDDGAVHPWQLVMLVLVALTMLLMSFFMAGTVVAIRRSKQHELEESRRQQAQRDQDHLAQRNALVREVHHRVKNNLQGLVGILTEYGRNHPQTMEPLRQVISQVQSISVIHGLQGKTAMDAVRLCELTESIAQNIAAARNTSIALDRPTPWQPCLIAASEAVPMALVLNELILNAVKHGQPGTVRIALSKGQEPDTVRIAICNAGEWTAPGPGEHVGLQLVQTLLPRHGAQLTHHSAQGQVHTELEIGAPVISLETVPA